MPITCLYVTKSMKSRKWVIGLGYQLNASEAFIRACDKFIFIGRGEPPAQSLIPVSLEIPINLPKPPETPKAANPPAIRKLLTKAFAKAPQDVNKWVSLTALGQALSQVQAGFQTNSYGHATLSKLLQSLPDFVELQTKDGAKSARLKSNRPAKPPKPDALRNLLAAAFAKAPQDANRWVSLAALGQALLQVQADFKTNTYGHANLSKFLQSLPDFVELQTKDSVKSARLKK